MGWDRKKRGPATGYFYRSRRINGQLRKEYVGKGRRAKQLAEEIAQRRSTRLADRRQIEEERTLLAPAKTTAETFRSLVLLLTRVTLLLSGWHEHHGDWRRYHV
jgi:hypothetical protein